MISWLKFALSADRHLRLEGHVRLKQENIVAAKTATERDQITTPTTKCFFWHQQLN